MVQSRAPAKANQVIVKVQLFGILGAMTRERLVVLNLSQGSTLGDVLMELGRRFGEGFHDRIFRAPGELFSYCRIFLNDIQVDDLTMKIEAKGPEAEVGIILLMASEGG